MPNEIDATQEIAAIFGPEGVLAKEMPGYEARPGQLAMARAVSETLTGGDAMGGSQGVPLAVEAGTGTGKTLAYLIPAALSRRKVVVSTGTLNLQDQIINKEVPFIKRHIAPDLSALCIKGRQNYLCLHRWRQMLATPQRQLFDDNGEMDAIRDWLKKTTTGDRAELTWLADNAPLWYAVSSTTSQCLGMHCPEAKSCFINRLRIKAAKAQLLIVNHHLFFSDLAIRRFGHAEVLPRYESVIFDEAHHLENVATRYFGISFSPYQALDLTRDIEALAQEGLKDRERKIIIQAVRAFATQADRFASLFPKETGRFPLLEFIDNSPLFHSEYETLKDGLTALAGHLHRLTQSGDAWGGMERRCEELLASLISIAAERDSSYVYWYERREKTVLLSASPIEVATPLREALYDSVQSVTFTSATLTTGGDFSYFLERLGLDPDTETLAVDTPFDYANRTLLYVPPNRFPAPQDPSFSKRLQQEVYDLLLASNGRALVLFTSVAAMRGMHRFLKDRLPFPLLVQGEKPKTALLETFQKDNHSVLLAVASFWEGVDVPGESLSCVIIDKLPFEVPSDPVIMARINAIKEAGGNPFFDFQTPRAILTLRQGVGRLMRTTKDRGVLALMDVRLFTKPYGRLFRQSLPPSPLTRDLEAVKNFFRLLS